MSKKKKAATKQKAKQKPKVDLEFIFRASPAILYQFFTTPSCLIRWFCDEVDITENTYTFSWDGYPEIAELLETDEDARLRFRWEESEDEEKYFEIRMSKSPVTSETILEITDYCDENEIEEKTLEWETSIKKLRQETGG